MYKHAKSAIITNGMVSQYFPLTRGIRQGDAMSALLYVIQAEPLASAIRNNKDIKEINVLNNTDDRELKLCQYVDDTNIFLQSPKYISPCLDMIKEFEKISGSKLNKEKTKGIVVKRRNMGREEEIDLVMGPEKVLGVLIGKNANMSDYWATLVDKVKTKLSKWEHRDLSFEGKIHVIKSLTLSTLLYALEMQVIEAKYIKDLNDILWEFLWSGKKKCQVSRKVCTLPKDQGGLGMIDLSTLIKVKRIKWVIRILESKKNDHWVSMPMTYFKCLDHQFGLEYFALKSTNTTDAIPRQSIPQFYKECILNFQELNRTARLCKNDGSDIIWGNSKILFNEKPLMFSHWARSGIIHISDIIKNGILLENNIYNSLQNKAGFIFEIQTIKSCLSDGCFTISQSNENFAPEDDSILKTMFRLPNGKFKALNELSSKDLYDILLLNEEVQIPSKLYWSNKFDGVDTKWKTWFMMNFVNKKIPRYCTDFNWKIFHGQVNSESRLQRMSLSDGICKLCNTHVENMTHLLYGCEGIRDIWTEIEGIINAFWGGPGIILDEYCVFGGLLDIDSNDVGELANMILSITRWEIWKRRNINRFENVLVPILITMYKIRF